MPACRYALVSLTHYRWQLLAASTVGFPATVAVYSRVRDLLTEDQPAAG